MIPSQQSDISRIWPSVAIPTHYHAVFTTGTVPTNQDNGSGSALFLTAGSGSALERIAGSESGSAFKSNFWNLIGSKWSRGGPWTLTREAWRLKIERWRVCRPVPQIRIILMRSKIQIRIHIKEKRWIRMDRIRFKAKSCIRKKIISLFSRRKRTG